MSNDTNFLLNLDNVNLPYSAEAEQALLGSIIIDPECMNLIATQIKIEYFYFPQHKEIYKTLSEMLEFEQLKSNGVYDEAGGKAYLTQLAKAVPTSANVLTYVDIVRERYYARSLLLAAEGIIKSVNENS